MRVLVAPDSFGGTLSAVAAAEAVVSGWQRSDPDALLVPAPLSDGGPGFVDVLHAALGGAVVETVVADPLSRPVTARYLRVEATAYVESAQACGLHLLADDERDPTRTTTFGVGELIGHALDAGARRVVVGLGGSSTNDGGQGLVAGLGGLAVAADRLRGVELVVATDVDNPLLGLHGASAVYGPQKGATRAQVAELDEQLREWADTLARETGRDARDQPGAGAAGGMGAALLALGGHRASGIGLVVEATRLVERLAAADLVVTGEGSFDSQSLRGKVVAGVARLAQQHALPCLVLAGQVHVGRREAAAAGVEAAYALVDVAGSVAQARERAAETLAELAGRVARQWHG